MGKREAAPSCIQAIRTRAPRFFVNAVAPAVDRISCSLKLMRVQRDYELVFYTVHDNDFFAVNRKDRMYIRLLYNRPVFV